MQPEGTSSGCRYKVSGIVFHGWRQEPPIAALPLPPLGYLQTKMHSINRYNDQKIHNTHLTVADQASEAQRRVSAHWQKTSDFGWWIGDRLSIQGSNYAA